MAGLKRVADQSKFRQKCERVADKVGIEVYFDSDKREDDAFEDDGCLHIRRHQLRAMFGIGEDTPGEKANEMVREIMEAVGLKRKIGKRVLVEEECETCNGDGETECSCCGRYSSCDDCDGQGFTTPEDYK